MLKYDWNIYKYGKYMNHEYFQTNLNARIPNHVQNSLIIYSQIGFETTENVLHSVNLVHL